MTEERGTYDLHHDDPDRGIEGVESLGDILRQLIDERGWPLAVRVTRSNGDSPGVDGDVWRGDG